jgi:hypothetical protein
VSRAHGVALSSRAVTSKKTPRRRKKASSSTTPQPQAASAAPSPTDPWSDSALSPAERQLLAAFKDGNIAKVSPTRPDQRTEDNWVRADFLRFLALGGDVTRRPHAHGLQLHGAWIEGALDLRGAEIALDFACCNCHFAERAPLDLRDTRFVRNLHFRGSLVHGIKGDRLQVAGDAEFATESGDDSPSFTCTAPIHLRGSVISGDLSFDGAQLDGRRSSALNLDMARVNGSVSLSAQVKRDGFLRFLALGEVRLRGARIGGDLSCIGARFDAGAGVALDIDSAQIEGSLHLRSGAMEGHRFEAVGSVRFLGSRIRGQLNCEGAHFDCESGVALGFDGAQIEGGVFLNSHDGISGEHRFEAVGMVRFLGARIGGQLVCSGARFDGKSRPALDFDGAQIEGSVFLQTPIGRSGEHRFEAMGEVRFLGARIGGDLTCIGARFHGNSGEALLFDGAQIEGSVFLQSQTLGGDEHRFEAVGTVRFSNAQIGGQLSCIGARLSSSGAVSLHANGARIKQSVGLTGGSISSEPPLETKGTVDLSSSSIGGNLEIWDATIDISIPETLSTGTAITLRDAVIDGRLRLGYERSSMATPLRGKLHCKGVIDARGMRVGKSLHIEAFKMDAEGASTRGAGEVVQLDFEHARIEHGFVFRPNTPIDGVNLHGASCASLEDDPSKWGEHLHLDGFLYSRFGQVDSGDAKVRIAWLDKQLARHRGEDGARGREFRPQPWQHLQVVFRAAGNLDWARTVAVEFEERLRRVGRIGTPAEPASPLTRLACRTVVPLLHRSFGLLAGYGHRPVRLMLWFLGVWLGCALSYWLSAAAGAAFGPSDPLVFQHPDYSQSTRATWPETAIGPPTGFRRTPLGDNWFTNPALPEEYPAFSPWFYSLDVILPLIDLQQETDWAPLVPTPRPGIAEAWHFRFGHLVRLVMWVETIFGWILSLLFVAIVSGLAKRRED